MLLAYSKRSGTELLFLGHRNLIKKITQTAVINIVFKRIFIELDVSHASQHTVQKWPKRYLLHYEFQN